MLKRLCQDQPRQWHRLYSSICLQRSSTEKVDRIQSIPVTLQTFSKGTWNDPKELRTEEVNIPEDKVSYQYITELHERLEDSLKLAQKELQKSPKRYK